MANPTTTTVLESAPMLRLVMVTRTRKPYRVQMEVAKGMWQTQHEYSRRDYPAAACMFAFQVRRSAKAD